MLKIKKKISKQDKEKIKKIILFDAYFYKNSS